jgi:hypothetical protein
MSDAINFSLQSELTWKGWMNDSMVWLQYGNFHTSQITMHDIVITLQRYKDVNAVQIIINSVPVDIEEDIFTQFSFQIDTSEDCVSVDGVWTLQLITGESHPWFFMGNMNYDDENQLRTFQNVLQSYSIQQHTTCMIRVDTIEMIFPLSESIHRSLVYIFSSKEEILERSDWFQNSCSS